MKTPLEIAETIASNVMRLGNLAHKAKTNWGLDVYEWGGIISVKCGDCGYFKSIHSYNLHVEITPDFPRSDILVYKVGTEEDLNRVWGVISEKLGLT